MNYIVLYIIISVSAKWQNADKRPCHLNLAKILLMIFLSTNQMLVQCPSLIFAG